MAVVDAADDRPLPAGRADRGHRDSEQARTAGFTVLVLAQLFNCFNARSETTSAFRHLFVNRWLWAAVACRAFLQVAVVHCPSCQRLSAPLRWTSANGAWRGHGSSVLAFGELRKLVLRATLHRARS